jgi:polysaccharide export outer membrane protein
VTYNAAAGGGTSPTGAGSSGSSGGYLVDAQGNIQLHKLGLIHAEGMTRAELKNKIQKDIEPYLKDPVVTVRYLNHRVSVLGEVSRPGVIQMPEERLSVLEVLSTSGDVTPFARRNNILVIRETANGKELKRLNLEDHSIFTSEWYYLQPDDVVYVEPNEKKLNEEKRNKTQQTVGLILSGVSLAVIILDRIIK